VTTVINPAAACERDNQTDELTEPELSKVIGGTGAGAGKVTFNPFSITKEVDVGSPVFYPVGPIR
jgi:type VI protein secretion system component Hcp